MDIEAIKVAFADGDYLFTEHALRRSIERHISRGEIEQAVARAEMIEEYSEDKYGPSCLLYGESDAGRALHMVVSVPPPTVKVVTVYEPDPAEWENGRTRRTQNE